MTKIKTVEYFRLPPRWLFVKIVDEDGATGWGEASLEGHTQAVEGCLDAYTARIIGMDAEYASNVHFQIAHLITKANQVIGSDIEHIWQMIYRLGFYRGGPVMMSALSGVSLPQFMT